VLNVPSLRRLFLALPLLAWGCGSGGYNVPYNRGHSANPTAGDVASLALDLAVGALEAGRAPTESTRESRPWASTSTPVPSPPPPPPAPPPESPARRLFGKVVWESGGRVPFVTVTLQGPSDFVALETRTDINGRFWFPWPLPAGWYRISADGAGAAGETRVWMNGRPEILSVVARAKEPPPRTD